MRMSDLMITLMQKSRELGNMDPEVNVEAVAIIDDEINLCCTFCFTEPAKLHDEVRQCLREVNEKLIDAREMLHELI